MSAEPSSKAQPPASALHTFLQTHPPAPSSPHSSDLHNLALQIAHNLKHMHLWTDLRLHTHTPRSSASASASAPPQPLPRPLLSGIPPHRLYVHPDEQIALLQRQKDAGKSGMPDLAPQREWVLPSQLREKWSLRRFGETFDAIGHVPGGGVGEGKELFGGLGEAALVGVEEEEEEEGEESARSWRGDMPKRLLLATLDDDSTVVYYIVHDGIVKPRQN